MNSCFIIQYHIKPWNRWVMNSCSSGRVNCLRNILMNCPDIILIVSQQNSGKRALARVYAQLLVTVAYHQLVFGAADLKTSKCGFYASKANSKSPTL